MIVTEIVKGIGTRDAKGTAIGTATATETGIKTRIVIDGTLACRSLVVIPSVVSDDRSCFSSQLAVGAVAVAITGNLKTVSDAVTCVSLALSLQYYLMSFSHL
jgi:hypothetical protein